MNRILELSDRIQSALGRLVSQLGMLLVVVVCLDVLMRYVFRRSSVAVGELEWHLFALVFLLVTAYTLKEDGHVRVDVFYQRFSPRKKAWIDLVGILTLLLPFCGWILWTAIPYALVSWHMGESSPDPGGLPARYLLKAALPGAYLLVAGQGVARALRCLQVLRPHSAPPRPPEAGGRVRTASNTPASVASPSGGRKPGE